jgi:hypothetical protein
MVAKKLRSPQNLRHSEGRKSRVTDCSYLMLTMSKQRVICSRRKIWQILSKSKNGANLVTSQPLEASKRPRLLWIVNQWSTSDLHHKVSPASQTSSSLKTAAPAVKAMQEHGRAVPAAVLLRQPEADTRAEEPVTVRPDVAVDLDEDEVVDLTVAAVAVEAEVDSTRAVTLLLHPLISLLLPAVILENTARINHDLFLCFILLVLHFR